MKVRYSKGTIHPDASNIMECLRMFKDYDVVREYLDSRYPMIGSGMYAEVYGISDDVVLKLSTPEDAGFKYSKAIVHGTLHRKLPAEMHQYLPKMYGIGYKPNMDMHDETGFYVVPMERLAVNDLCEGYNPDAKDPQHRTLHLMEMFQDGYSMPYQGKRFQTDCLQFGDLDAMGDDTLRCVVRSVNRQLFALDACTKQEVQFLKFARTLLMQISVICPEGDMDMHTGNIMVRETTNGPVLVVTDPVC